MIGNMDEGRGGVSDFYEHPRSDLGWLMRRLMVLATQRVGMPPRSFAAAINNRLAYDGVSPEMLNELVHGIGQAPPDVLAAALDLAGADLRSLLDSLTVGDAGQDDLRRPPSADATSGLGQSAWLHPRRPPQRVFLSHTSELRDHPRDRSYVQAAEAAVIRAGHAVSDMAYFAARDSEPADYCRAMVASANVYAGIVGHRYGALVRGRPDLSYTEAEFEVATELRLPRLIFLIRDDARSRPPVHQPEEHRARQETFRRRLREAGLTMAWIDSPADLEVALHQSLVELTVGKPAPIQGVDELAASAPYYQWDMKRRQFVRAGGAGLVLAALSPLPLDAFERLSARAARAPLTLDALDSYWQIIDQCWVLCNSGQLSPVDSLIQGLLPELARHAADRPAAAALTSQSLRLLGIVRTHELRLQDKMVLSQQAVEYARRGSDPTTLVAALTELAVAFKYADQPENSFATYLEAVVPAEQAAPLVRSRVYAATAAAFAQRSLAKDAEGYIHRAYKAFPSDPQSEPHWLSADYGIWLLAFYEGMTHLSAGRADEADRAFRAYQEHPMAGITPERNRLEILNQRCRAAIMAGDLEQFADHLQSALAGATAIGSRKRLDEALAIYRDEMPVIWRQTAIMRQLADRFQLGYPEPDSSNRLIAQ